MVAPKCRLQRHRSVPQLSRNVTCSGKKKSTSKKKINTNHLLDALVAGSVGCQWVGVSISVAHERHTPRRLLPSCMQCMCTCAHECGLPLMRLHWLVSVVVQIWWQSRERFALLGTFGVKWAVCAVGRRVILHTREVVTGYVVGTCGEQVSVRQHNTDNTVLGTCTWL